MQEISQAMSKGLSSFSAMNEAILEAQDDVSFVISEMPTYKQFDSHMTGFGKALSCEDDTLREYAIGSIFSRMNNDTL